MTETNTNSINTGSKGIIETEEELDQALTEMQKSLDDIDNIRYCNRFPDDPQMRASVDKFFRNLGEASTEIWNRLPDHLKPYGTEAIFRIWDAVKEHVMGEKTA